MPLKDENNRTEFKPSQLRTKQNRPDITIETAFELWMDIITGKADGQQMFMEQKYKVDGDLTLMIQLFQKENNNQ
jgi:putative sterol carrier protein